MADILISNRRPGLPSEEAVYWKAPVRGEALFGLAGTAAHLNANRAMGRAFLICNYDANTGAAHGGDVLRQDPGGVNQDLVIPWTQHPLATHVLVWIQFQAHQRGGTHNPQIDVTLRTVAGVAIDDPAGGVGVRLSEANHNLGAGQGFQERDGATLIYPIRRVSLVRVTATPAAAAYPTGPRALEYGTGGGASQRVEVRVQTTDARIIRVDVQERPRTMVSQ